MYSWDFFGCPVVGALLSQCGGPGLIPDQETRSHMQTRSLNACSIHMLQRKMTILCASVGTWCGQISRDKYIFKKENTHFNDC